MNPILPLAALACWMAGMTAAIYGRRLWAWAFILAGLGLLAFGAWTAR